MNDKLPCYLFLHRGSVLSSDHMGRGLDLLTGSILSSDHMDWGPMYQTWFVFAQRFRPKSKYYTILYYTILYYTIPYHYIILYYIIWYYIKLYYIIWYFIILYYIILYYIILYTAIVYTYIWYNHTPPRDEARPHGSAQAAASRSVRRCRSPASRRSP